MDLLSDNRTKWADIKPDDDLDPDGPSSALTGFETVPNKDGIKTVTNYLKNENGLTIKAIRKVKVTVTTTTINQAVIDREGLAPFGATGHMDIPIVPLDEYHIERPKERVGSASDDEAEVEVTKDPNLHIIRDIKQKFMDLDTADVIPSAEAEKPSVDKDRVARYVPPRMKKDRIMEPHKDECTIRVTNLSEDVHEENLKELFGRVGTITRMYLAKHKETLNSKGFAFVTYRYKEQAAEALRKLNRHGYDNLLLNVEWARPSTKER